MIDFIKQYAKCNLCTFKENRKVPTTFPDDPQYRMLLIGQGPGEVEEITQIPFSGPSGKLLFGLLKTAGIYKTKVFISNLICCTTPDNREPNKIEIDNCHNRLKAAN